MKVDDVTLIKFHRVHYIRFNVMISGLKVL